jgi:hypothetical protein
LPFRFLTSIDIEGFSRRSAAAQAKAQDDLEYVMSEAATRVGMDRRHWYRQARGDGELAVLAASASSLSVVADYPRELGLVLAKINSDAESRSRLRVRMAIHHGAVSPGRFGPVGAAAITVSRLVDAQALRQTLKQRGDLDIVLAVSAAVYHEVVQSGFRGLDPRTFHRVNVRSKGTLYIGYLYLPENSKISSVA